MFVLKNKRGNEQKNYTNPIAFSYNFWKALLNIENGFQLKGETFTIHKDNRRRQLNHLTSADLVLATVLHVACNTQGQIWGIKPFEIYSNYIEKLYEKPIASSQFYESLEKFKQHKLIIEEKIETTGKYKYTLNHFIVDDSKKIGRYVLIHPVVFLKSFTDLPLSHKKLYYLSIMQTGDYSKELYRNLENTKDTVASAGLLRILHKEFPYQIRNIFKDLTEIKVFKDEPLFSKAYINGKTAYFTVNQTFIINSKSPNYKNKEYREPIKPKNVYSQLSNLMKKTLEGLGVGEITLYNNSRYFVEMIYSLKKYNRTEITYVLHEFKSYFNRYQTLPLDIPRFIRENLDSKIKAKIIQIVRNNSIYHYISPFDLSRNVRKQREFDFASRISSEFSEKQFSKVCRGLKSKILGFQRPVEFTDYIIEKELNGWNDILAIRQAAYLSKIDLNSYTDLESQILYKLKSEDESNYIEIRKWAIEKLNVFTSYQTCVPDVPSLFLLEDFLIVNSATIL